MKRLRLVVPVVAALTAIIVAAASAPAGAQATPPRNTVRPTIAGTPQRGQTLTVNPGTWTGTAPITYTYQWQRCGRNGGNCARIIGATNPTYRLTAADVGRTVRVVVRARNAAGSAFRTSLPTAVVRGAPAAPAGQVVLPNGKISVPVSSVSLPSRLVIDQVIFSPNPVRSRNTQITVRVHVSDTRGFVVRDALVFVRSTPLVTTTPPETATQLDGWATLVTRPRSAPGIRFPLQNGLNVQFFVQARKQGERLLYGVTGTRLVQVRTATPR